MKKIEQKKRYQGYVTLTSVVVLSLIALSAITSMLLINSTALKVDKATSDSARARYAAESCVEIALRSLQSDLDYTQTSPIQVGASECQVEQILGNGNIDRTIQSVGENDGSTVRIEVIVSEIQPFVIIESWDEVAQF